MPPEQQISIEAARQLLEAHLPPPGLWGRLRDYFSPGSGNITHIELEERGFWRLTSGTCATSLMPTDAVGWRFLLSLVTPGDPRVYLRINQRLYAAFCDGDR